MATLREIRSALVELARRHSRVAHEAEDVAHDILLSALRRRSPLEGEAFLRCAAGAARRHGAFLARGASRRRARELSSGGPHAPDISVESRHEDGTPLSVLSPPLRTTLLLLHSGLEKAELRLALGVTDATLRKRFQALRSHSPLARADLPVPDRPAALALVRRSQVRLLPRLAVTPDGRRGPRVLATSDPDGHGLIFAEALTSDRGAATSDASASERTRSKGSSCSMPNSRTSPSSS
jgi:DNA-directed RNA polymerase specialized sigma24 family protein